MQKTTNMTHLSQTTIVSKEVTLLNGQQVSKEFYDLVCLAASRSVMGMECNRLYVARELCGGDFWQTLTNSEKRRAGRCLAHMVSNKVFDWQFVKYKKSPTKRYLKLDDM